MTEPKTAIVLERKPPQDWPYGDRGDFVFCPKYDALYRKTDRGWEFFDLTNERTMYGSKPVLVAQVYFDTDIPDL